MQIVLRPYLLIYGSGCFLGSGLNMKYFFTTGNTKRKHFFIQLQHCCQVSTVT